MYVSFSINSVSHPVFDLSLDGDKEGWRFTLKTKSFAELWAITPATEIKLSITDAQRNTKRFDLAVLQIQEDAGSGFATLEGMDRATYKASVTPAQETAAGSTAASAVSSLGTQAGITAVCQSADLVHSTGSSQTVRQALENIAQGTGQRLIATGTGLKVGTGNACDIQMQERKRSRKYAGQIHTVRVSKVTLATHSGVAQLEGDPVSCGGILYQGLFGFPDGSDLSTSPFWDAEEWEHGWPEDYAGVEDMLAWYADHWHVPNASDAITSVSEKQGLPLYYKAGFYMHVGSSPIWEADFYTEKDIQWATALHEPDPDSQATWRYSLGGELCNVLDYYQSDDSASLWRMCYLNWYRANEIRKSRSIWGTDDQDMIMYLMPAQAWVLAEYTFGTDGHLKSCRLLKDRLIGRIDPNNLTAGSFNAALGYPFWQRELLTSSLPGILRYAGYAPSTGRRSSDGTPVFDRDAWVYGGSWQNLGAWQTDSVLHWQAWLSKATGKSCKFEAVYSINDFYYNPWKPYENCLHLLPAESSSYAIKVPAEGYNNTAYGLGQKAVGYTTPVQPS